VAELVIAQPRFICSMLAPASRRARTYEPRPRAQGIEDLHILVDTHERRDQYLNATMLAEIFTNNE
jgi:hypothetical protein